MSKATLASPFALALVVSAAGCGPEIPPAPTYATDVRPILMAHCGRCHGAELAGEPGGTGMPGLCHFNTFENTGDCSTAGMAAGNCNFGAQYCGTLMAGDPPSSYITTYINIPQAGGGMPPLPSPALNDWEHEVLQRWSSANPAP